MFHRPLALTAAALTALAGCGGDDSSTPLVGDPATCTVVALDRQPTRLVAGRTYYLPRVDGADCEGRWERVEGPEDNAPVVGADGWTRVVPLAPGEHVFAHPHAEPVRVAVVAAGPFEHFNYQPVQSVLPVGDELWVAQVFAPELVRLDAATLAERGRVQTGPWPVSLAWAPGSDVVLVAQKADDTLGFVDRASGRLVDAVRVGDEPAHVVVSPDGATAWVALATEGAVAVVDVAARAVVGRIEANPDPMAMALDPETGRLYVASHRSAQGDRHPFGSDDRADAFDIAVIEDGAVTGYIEAVGSTINALHVAGGRLHVSVTSSTPRASLADPEGGSFRHEVVVYDRDGVEQARADLGRQPGSAGPAVTTHGIASSEGSLWVAVEGSDVVVELDPETLAERGRIAAPGRPRAVAAVEGGVVVHGAQGFAVTRVRDGMAETVTLAGDPRSAAEALGQRYFTGPGEGYGIHHTCNSCHMDAIMDGNVWKAGPFELWAVTRPFFWLEGTFPLGWEGYLTDARNFAVTVGSTIGKNPDDTEARGLAAYLTALVPPPAANGQTRRDGALSEAGARGEAIFAGKGGCVACHSGEITTSRQVLPEGVTPGMTDIPSLVGAYRYGFWLKSGLPRTLAEVVDEKVDWLGITLSADERADLARYVGELTARDAFLLTSDPRAGEVAAIDRPIELVFSHPLHDDAANEARVRLLAAGEPVAVTVTIAGRRVRVTPASALRPGTAHVVELDGLETFEGHRVAAASVPFTTQAAPALRFDGEYRWRVQFPAFDREAGGLDPRRTSAVDVALVAAPTDSGGRITARMTDALSIEVPFVLDGETLAWPAMALPLGGTSFASAWPTTVAVEDTDGDGIVDRGEGEMRVSGPGFEADGVQFALERPAAGCADEATGSHPLTVEGEGAPTIAWTGPNALGVYVTEPGAQPPLGPGRVTGGATYWAVQTTAFPQGFAGPVIYGEVPTDAADVSEPNGAPAGGAAIEAGTCVTIHVQLADFSTSTLTRLWR
ncbi:MAG: Ig-like domain-containing protein [Myxococcales bacterium]|nr:Ig-like domain-containing protein [Myxococcales bacterium]